MTTKYKKSLQTNVRKFLLPKHKNTILKSIKEESANAYIKDGTFSTEIVWGKKSFVFSNQGKRDTTNFRKGMFLFSMVRRDAAKFLKTQKFKIPKKYKSVIYNEENRVDLNANMTATDLNHAYWRIAYNLGIISDNTYIKGLPDKFKQIRLAALSTMGRKKQYSIIKNGEITDDVLIIEGDENLAEVYTLIRYTCFKYMNDVRKLLGKDFLCYRTDCIYYLDTVENREKVMQYFSKKELFVKQLS
jgi:hypothetical protein